jgi:hypothetical protein
MSYFRYPVGTGPLPPALAYDAASTPVADQILLEMSAGDLEGRPDLIMDASGDMSSPAVQRALHYLADSGTGDKALIGLAGLVGHGEVASLLRAETMALSLTGNTGGPGYIISAIGNVRLTDPVAVACLGRMATTQSNSVLLRDRSAHALAAIHTVDAVPWLGKLLSDPSNALKLIGATGMSFFVNGVGIPTPETMLSLSHLNQRSPSPYRTTGTDQHIGYALGQEGSFVDFWTSWWNEHPELRSQN